MNKVFPLSKERLASCSHDRTVKIWKDDNTYECISTLENIDEVNSILQLRGKEILVSAYKKAKSLSLCGISFWNIGDYTHQHTIKGYGIHWPTHMIELFNGNIALSSSYPFLIVIIDSSSYEVKK